jgi:hypothetical protein
LFPHDPSIEHEPSGVLKTEYNLDNQGYINYSGPIAVDSEGSHTLLYKTTDKAGNKEQEQELSFIIDTTSPEIISSNDGMVYIQNQQVQTDFSCIDTNLISCDSDVGIRLDTYTLGVHTFTVSAADAAGNQRHRTVNYKVFGFNNLFSPVVLNGKTFKKSSTIPVKFQLIDGQGNFLGNLSVQLFIDPTPE